MTPAQIQTRLEDVLQSIFCPVVGCYFTHGCHYEFYQADGCYVLEVWPEAVEEHDVHKGNGGEGQDLIYELAEFEFSEMVREIPWEHFHFSQRRQIFEIGWKEDGLDFELRVHIVPAVMDEG